MATKQSEPWRFSAQTLDLLDKLVATLRPDDANLAIWCKEYYENHRQRIAGDIHILDGHVNPNARILEYGAIPLLLTAALKELKRNVESLDIAPHRFSKAIAAFELNVTQCEIETQKVPFHDGSFDAVLFNELFEHLRINPVFTLREVHRVLKPGGRLLLSTPNLRSLRGLRNLIFYNQGHAISASVYEQYEKLEQLGHMGHVREYTTREVSEFLEHIGFRIDTVIYRGGHYRGIVGMVERLALNLRPFFSLIATRI